MKLKLAAAAMAGMMAFGADAVTTNRTEEVIRPGFTLVKYVCDDTPCWRAYLMKVDLDTPGLRFDIGYPNGDEIGTTVTVSNHAAALKTKLETQYGAGKVLFQTGINCDFFGGDGYTQRLNIRDGQQVQTGYNPNCVNWGAGNVKIYETTDGKFHMSGVDFAGSLTIGGADYTIGYVNTINVDNIASGVAVFTDGYLGTMPAAGVEIEFDEPFAAGGGVTLAGKPFKVIGPISSGAKFSGRSAKRGALVGLSAGEQSTIAALAANTTGTLSWSLTGVKGAADVRNLAGVWLWVLRDGEYVPNDDQHEDFATYTKGYPRTCMGLSSKNNQAVFFVNDGRQKDWSMHMSTAQVAALLKAEGCENGGQFDGGGSTTLWDSVNGVENSPCGGENPGTGKTYAVGEQREVAQTMFFSVIDTGDTPPTPPAPQVEVGTECLVNGGFEDSSNANGWNYFPTASSTGWEATSGCGISKSGQPWTSGSNLPVGTYAAYIQGNGSMQQTFTAPCRGTYEFSLKSVMRAQMQSGHIVSVVVDGVTNLTFTSDNNNYVVRDCSFGLDAGEHTLEFRGKTTGGDQSSVIDDVSLKFVNPEVSIPVPTFSPHAAAYNGENHAVTFSSLEHIVVGGVTNATEVGTYEFSLTPEAGYAWPDFSKGTTNITWRILPVFGGGGETVIHVKADAAGKGDGSDWANAVTTLAAALPLIDASSGRTNIWISGDCVLTGELGISVPVTILGGFAGTESAADERAANARSVIDGDNVVGNLLVLSAASGTTLLDQLVLTKAKTRAIYKSGAGSLTVRNSEIKDILSGISATGHAIEASGNASVTRMTLEGVTVLNVRDNTQGNHPWNVEGTLFRFTGMKEVALRDTIIRECGCKKDLTTSCSGRENNPNLITSYGVPIHATNVKFVGNRTGDHDQSKGGAMIFLSGNCSGSTFDHCLFAANCNVTFGQNQNNRGGVVTSEMSALGNTVSFESCTFAYNVSGTCPTAGINLLTGTANLHNCIFFGNVVSTQFGKAADLYLRGSNAKANISYCSFTEYATTVKAAAGTLNPTEGTVLEGDPLFATTKETFLSDYLVSGTKAIPASAYNCTINGSADFDALDLHLRSTVARWNGTEWVQDATLSPMIDSGDPASEATNEPAPSKCIDLGFYGNTCEASAPSSIVPKIASVEFMQPTPASEYHASFKITMGGETGYSAVTYLCYGLTEHDGVDGWDHKVVYSGSECGSVHTETVAEYHTTGTPLKWRVYTENKNGSDVAAGTFTYAGATPTITAGEIDQDYFYTRPLFTASIANRSAAGEVSVSEVYLCYGTEQSAADGTNGWSTVRRVGTLKSPGDTIEMTPIRLVATGTKYYYRWVVMDALGMDETAILETTVTGSEPPGFVNGHAFGLNPSEASGEEVTFIHVWSEAKGLGDGSDWANACTDLQTAALLASGSRTNVVLAGTVEVKSSGVANFTVPVRILGGFTGYQDTLTERDPAKRAVVEGRNVGKGIYFSATTGTTLIEDVEVKRMNGRGIEKANAGNLELRRCRIEDNGVNASQIGVGMYAAGNAGSSSLLCEGVDFVGNVLYNGDNYNGSGCGAYVTSFKKATFTNCDFIGNGVRTSGWNGGGGRDGTRGYALYLDGAPATLTGCRFIGNRYVQNNTGWKDGTAVSVEGNGDGTLFKNCLFLANQGQRYGQNSYSTTVYAGALGVRMDNASRKLALESCTFAYNVNSSGCTAGLDVYSGAVTVHNSIFWGNLLSDAATPANCGADIAILGSGTCTVSHSIVSGKTTPFVKGNVSFGENVETKDPLFVHGFDELAANFLTHDGTADFANAVGGTRMYYENSLDLDTLDVHLKSHTGWTDETTGQLVKSPKENGASVFSPAIDAGDPESDFSLEPMPNGKRVNLGCYGNTPWASMSQSLGMQVLVR